MIQEEKLLFTLKDKQSGLLTITDDNLILIEQPSNGGGGGGSSTWGGITGTLSDQTDLQTALNLKEDTSNKKTDLEANKTSNTFYASCKAVVDWVYNFFIPLAGIIVSGRKIKLAFLSTGLKISSRSDGSDIGVILKTDNLTADRTRTEQDKDGTYALVEDGYIPLTGTEAGSHVTGNLDFNYNDEWIAVIGLNPISEESIGIFNNESTQKKFVDGNGFINYDILGVGINEIIQTPIKGIESTIDHSENYTDYTYVQKKWVDDNFASKSATAKTGTALTFTSLDIYGTFTTPSTTNITVDLTGAKLGIVQKMYHQNGTAPTFPTGFVKISGTYSTVGKNIIYFEFSEGTRVEYWIVNL